MSTADPLRNQHGPRINPTNPELISKVGSALAPHGGERFVTPDVMDDHLTKRLVEEGHVWPQKAVRAKGAECNGCHDVSVRMGLLDHERQDFGG